MFKQRFSAYIFNVCLKFQLIISDKFKQVNLTETVNLRQKKSSVYPQES